MVESDEGQHREAVDFLLKAAMLKAAMTSLIRREFSEDEDEAGALRRLLLALIWTVQDEASPSAQHLIDDLLLEFPPLAGRFDERHRHPLVAGEEVMRVSLGDGRTGLLIRAEFGKHLLDEAIEGVRAADE